MPATISLPIERCKYIRLQWAGFILWDVMAPLSHAQVAQALDIPGDGVISAGFVQQFPGGDIRCTGHSFSLRVNSLPEDTERLRQQLGLSAAGATA